VRSPKYQHCPDTLRSEDSSSDGGLSTIFQIVNKNEIELVEGMRCKKICKCYRSIKVYTQETWYAITIHNYFEAASLFVIIANSVLMALEDPTTEESSSFLEFADNIFLGLYTLEMVLKILGNGFIFPK
jgi:uncharacterized membrane protein